MMYCNVGIIHLLNVWIKVKPVLTVSIATKEMDNPEATAETVGIGALIVQVNDHE